MAFDEIKQKLFTYLVGIAGGDGLGSNCAVALARVGKLVIADFDTIVESNLNRQYFFYDQIGLTKVSTFKTSLNRITSSCKEIAHGVRITLDDIPWLFHFCNVIVEAFNSAGQKLMEQVTSIYPEKLLVCASGLAGFEHFEFTEVKRFGNLVVCGYHRMQVSEKCVPLTPKVSIVVNMQTNIVSTTY